MSGSVKCWRCKDGPTKPLATPTKSRRAIVRHSTEGQRRIESATKERSKLTLPNDPNLLLPLLWRYGNKQVHGPALRRSHIGRKAGPVRVGVGEVKEPEQNVFLYCRCCEGKPSLKFQKCEGKPSLKAERHKLPRKTIHVLQNTYA